MPGYPATMNLFFCLSILAFSAGEPTPSRPAKGQVLILDNDRTLEGEIEKVGDQYRLRRGDAVTWISGQNSAVLCPDLVSAHKALRQRANLQDADERIRLARWCLAHNLKEQALDEAKAALTLRPEHNQTVRLVRHLQNREAVDEPAKPAAGPSEADIRGLQLTTDSLSLFTRGVQPILMNACASCHATDKGGPFRLTRSYDPGLGNRRILQANIAAVLAQINTAAPLSSPLLVKSVSVHGGQAHPALKGRNSEPYRLLEEWARMVSEEHAVSRPAEPNLLPAGFASDDRKGRVRPPETRQPEPAKPSSEPGRFADGQPARETAAKPAETVSRKPEPAPAPADPYDPAPFNQLPAPKIP
ncbi:MAG: hypothetical protein ACKO9Z_16930 [Planctomycetota bacterium]